MLYSKHPADNTQVMFSAVVFNTYGLMQAEHTEPVTVAQLGSAIHVYLSYDALNVMDKAGVLTSHDRHPIALEKLLAQFRKHEIGSTITSNSRVDLQGIMFKFEYIINPH